MAQLDTEAQEFRRVPVMTGYHKGREEMVSQA